MNYRRLIGLCIVALGLIVVGLSSLSMKKLSSSQQSIPNNLVGDLVGRSSITTTTPSHGNTILYFSGGIALFILGGAIIVFSRNSDKQG